MPKGVSRLKHPELYNGKTSKANKATTKKFGRGTAKLGTKKMEDTNADFIRLHNVTQHLGILVTIRNQMVLNSINNTDLTEEIRELVDITIEERRKLIPDAEDHTDAVPTMAVTRVNTAPPPAPGLSS